MWAYGKQPIGKGNDSSCPFPKVHPSELERGDEYFMKLAYNQAVDGWNEGEVPVGAVISINQTVVARAHNLVETSRDPTAHAEILALTQAARHVGDWRLNDATLFVTKEPCPMCAGAALNGRLSRVVFGMSDPKMGCLGGVTDLNALPEINHHFEVVGGVLKKECLELIRSFFIRKRKS